MPKLFDLIKGAGRLFVGDGKLLEKGSEILDEIIYSKEERAEYDAEMARRDKEYEFRLKEFEQESIDKSMQYDIRVAELEIQDKDSARKREVNIAKSAPDKIWGFTVNMSAIIGISIIVMYFSLELLWAIGVLENQPDTKNWENLTIMAVSYYLGSSLGSREKNRIIESKLEKP